MNTRSNLLGAVKNHPLGVLLGVGILFRILLFDVVVINTDTGLYLYDSYLILQGQTPVVDYPTRSPLFHYFLASGLALNFSPIITARLMMIGISVLLAAAIFGYTSRMHSTPAAVAATAVFLFTPFAAIWGLWVKTEQAAELIVLFGLLLVAPKLKEKTIPYRYPAILGVTFGVAFLVRRVIIIHFVAIILFLFYYRTLAYKTSLKDPIINSAVVLSTTLATLLVEYTLLGWPSGAMIRAVIEEHFISLFTGKQISGVAWVELTTVPEPTSSSASSVLGVLCPECSVNTILIMTRVATVILPALLLILVFPLSYRHRVKDVPARTTAIVGGLILAGVVGLWMVILPSLHSRLLILAISLFAVAFALYAIFAGVPRPGELWSHELALPGLIILGLSAGYLLRDRVLFMTYFQDIFPWVAILAGIAGAKFYATMEMKTSVRGVGTVLLVGAFCTAMIFSYPLLPAKGVFDSSVDGRTATPSEVRTIATDLQSQTEPGETIFTAQPLYVLEADREVTADLSRSYWLFAYGPDTAITEQKASEVQTALSKEEPPYVIMDGRTRNVLQRSSQIAATVRENYCPVTDSRSHAYDQVGVDLYHRTAEAPDCAS